MLIGIIKRLLGGKPSGLARPPEDNARAANLVALGDTLKAAGDTDAAEVHYREAIALDSAMPEAQGGLASVLLRHGKIDEARGHLRQALAVKPDYAEAQWNMMFLLLLLGDYEAGLTLHEKRFWIGTPAQRKSSADTLAVFASVPQWKGGSLGGRNLLLWSEQGLGDSLMMLRFLPLLAARQPAAIDVWCESPLARVVQAMPGVTRVISKDDPLSLRPDTVHCSLMSLPYIFQTRLESIPRQVPYLPVVPDDVRAWRARLDATAGLKVGVTWAGNPQLPEDAIRSVALSRLEPLLASPGVCLVSLQKGTAAGQRAQTAPQLLDWMDECQDFLDTAALVSCLDLVITVDTAIAHLAGALGKRVWLLNRYESEWRWLLEREDSPWYPTMRIFRQTTRGDWDAVIARMAEELRRLTITDGIRNEAEACKEQGNAELNRGDPERASAAYRRAIALRPDFAEAHNNLGLALAALGRSDDAIASYRQALGIKPDLGQAHTNLGNAYREQGRFDEALSSYREAVRLSPALPAVHNNLGVHLLDFGRHEEAKSCFEAALALAPTFAEAHNNLGNVFRGLSQLDEALACFQRAIALKPDLAKAHNNLGTIYQDRGLSALAYASYREALRIDFDYAEAHSNFVFARQYDVECSGAELLAAHRKFAKRFEAPLIAHWPRHINARNLERRLKIGFVSGDLRSHPVGFFLESVLAQIDREAFEIALYPTSPRMDAITDRLRARGDAWHPITGLSDDRAAQCIMNDAVDILVDLAGHTAENRLLVFARKPAPIQVSWLYFSTTGLAAMDYLLCDRHVVPETEDRDFIEKPWRLPDSYLCFTPPQEDIEVGPLAALTDGIVTFGCFNNLAKINDAVVSLWARVLDAVPGSRLFLKAHQLNDGTVHRDVRARFAARGIAAERLTLEGPSSRADYLTSYRRVDIALDPFPFPGGTTTVEALWMGVPVLNRRGERFISHAGESILRATGLPDWIARDDSEYVAIAARRAADLVSLACLRQGLRGQLLASPLCDAPRFARNLETAWREMWRAYCARA